MHNKMDNFLQKYILLANKNSPIIISKGKYITDNIFNKQLCRGDVDTVISKLGSVSGIKMKITQHILLIKLAMPTKLS